MNPNLPLAFSPLTQTKQAPSPAPTLLSPTTPIIALLRFTRCKLFSTAGGSRCEQQVRQQACHHRHHWEPFTAWSQNQWGCAGWLRQGAVGARGVGCSRVNDGVRPTGSLHMRAIWGMTARSGHATWLIIKQTGPASTITRVSQWAEPVPPTAGLQTPPQPPRLSPPPFVFLTQHQDHVF